MVIVTTPPTTPRLASITRRLSTIAAPAPGAMNSRYSLSVESRLASSMTCDSTISSRMSSGISESSV